MDATKSSRPDGREETPALAALRHATRALRLHLNSLPVDFNEVTTPDRFLTGLAFMSACQRFEAAESMIGSGFGGTVLGSLCRSVFFDGLRWLWVSADPGTRRRALLVTWSRNGTGCARHWSRRTQAAGISKDGSSPSRRSRI